MTNELRDRNYGQTIEEWIARIPGELAVDAVGLWQVVSIGRQGFDLSGEALTEHVRRTILALLAEGAKSVIGVANAVHGRGWLPVDYGSTLDEVTDAIISEWLDKKEEASFRVWFALPHLCLEP